jgi:hypothetical protein
LRAERRLCEKIWDRSELPKHPHNTQVLPMTVAERSQRELGDPAKLPRRGSELASLRDVPQAIRPERSCEIELIQAHQLRELLECEQPERRD